MNNYDPTKDKSLQISPDSPKKCHCGGTFTATGFCLQSMEKPCPRIPVDTTEIKILINNNTGSIRMIVNHENDILKFNILENHTFIAIEFNDKAVNNRIEKIQRIGGVRQILFAVLDVLK